MRQFFSDWLYLSVRNIRQIWRPLMALIPSLFIPVFFFVVNSTSLQAFAQVKGFPNVSYKDFIAPVAIFTAIFFSAGNAGIEMAQDISSGYFKKLIIMPIHRVTIVLSKLSEIAVLSVIQGLVVLILLLAVGVHFKTEFWNLRHFRHADDFRDGLELHRHDRGAGNPKRAPGAIDVYRRVSVSLSHDFAGAAEPVAADVSLFRDLQSRDIHHRRHARFSAVELEQSRYLAGFCGRHHTVRRFGDADSSIVAQSAEVAKALNLTFRNR